MLDYDVLVVGGGIHGVGVAQAAAARGYRTLLVEKERLAAGTSSRSSKLIHGGLRYLESLELRLVRECLREREILTRIAPDLVNWVPFFIPIYDHSSRGPWTIRAGLSLYALLGGLREKARYSRIAPDELERLDGLQRDGLRAVFRYWDAHTDDAALTSAVMRSAEELGAELRCPATLVRAHAVDGGYEATLEGADGVATVTASIVVNATGPWIEEIHRRVDPAPVPPESLQISLVQGTHLLFDEPLDRGVYYTEAPRDRRPVFVMPWQDGTLVGTTERVHEGPPETVTPHESEIEYLCEAYAHYFPERDGDHLSAFAGLRVLPSSGNVNRRSRETMLLVDDEAHPHWLTIAGGKLTSYRATAQQVLARLRATLPAPTADHDTAELPLPVNSPIEKIAPPRLEPRTP